MLEVRVERGRRVQIDHPSIDERAHESGRAKRLEHLAVLALAAPDEGREEHEPLPGGAGEDGIHHLAHGAGVQREAWSGQRGSPARANRSRR